MGNSRRNNIIYQPPHVMDDSNRRIYRRVETWIESQKTIQDMTAQQIAWLFETKLNPVVGISDEAIVQQLFNLKLEDEFDPKTYFPFDKDDKQACISVIFRGERTYRLYLNVQEAVNMNPLGWDVTYDAVYNYIQAHKLEVEEDYDIECEQDRITLDSCIIVQRHREILLGDIEIVSLVEHIASIENFMNEEFNNWMMSKLGLSPIICRHISKICKIVLG